MRKILLLALVSMFITAAACSKSEETAPSGGAASAEASPGAAASPAGAPSGAPSAASPAAP